jgi:hypothetical protein
MPNPELEADTIRFGAEEAARMHALALGDAAEQLRNPSEGSEPVVLQTYTLQLLGPMPPKAFQLLNLQHWAFPSMMRETEENLTDLLPEGYSVKIVEQP